MLHALAIGGQGDSPWPTICFRDRKSLSPLGRAYLALALLQMDRKETAAESSLKQSRNPKRQADKDCPPKRRADIEAQALTAVALLGLDSASPQAKALVETISSQRTGFAGLPKTRPGRPSGRAAWLAKDRAAGAVPPDDNGQRQAGQDARSRSARPDADVDVPMSLLVKGKQRIEFHTRPGELPIAPRSAALIRPKTSQGSSPAWHIERTYEPPLMEVDGKKIPRGFSTLSGDTYRAEFSNRMNQLPAARRGFVELRPSIASGSKRLTKSLGLDRHAGNGT